MALSAYWHVHLGSSNQHIMRTGTMSEREVGHVVAHLADGRQLLDLLAERDQVGDVFEAGAEEGGVERGDDHHFPGVGSFFTEFFDLQIEYQ